MANTPQPYPNNFNTAGETRRDNDKVKNFKMGLYDIDLTLADYMNDVINPKIVGPGGEVTDVPIIYGSAERWASARKFGYIRDQKGQIQLPLVMFRRNSVARNTQYQITGQVNRQPQYSFHKNYTSKNRYDKFSIMNGVKPTMERYGVVHPNYVVLTYDCMAWTSFTDHLNPIIEQFNMASEHYWGDKSKYKFKVSIDSFDINNELTENQERLIRANFQMTVYAFLLPEYFNDKINTIKSFTPKRVMIMTEIETNDFNTPGITDLVGTSTENTTLNSYQILFDYLSMSNQFTGTYIEHVEGEYSLFKFENTELMPIPRELADQMVDSERFDVFIGGTLANVSSYTLTNSSPVNGNNDVVIRFSSDELGFTPDNNSDVVIKGKIMPADNGAFATLLLGRDTSDLDPTQDYQTLIDFLALNEEFTGTYVSGSGTDEYYTFNNAELVSTPGDLQDVILESDKYRVFINGVEEPASSYTLINSNRFGGENNVTIILDETSVGFDIDGSDQILIKGKITSIS